MIRRILFVGAFLFLATATHAQVFNTGQTLKKGTFSLGVEPVLHVDGGADGLVLFAHGGYGLKSGIDLAFKAGFANPNYIGGDIEFAISPNISVAAGAHQFQHFGLDGTINFNIPIRNDIDLYTGLDGDLLFPDGGDTRLALWVPVGLEVGLRPAMSFLLEAEIELSQAYHVFGGGLCFYL